MNNYTKGQQMLAEKKLQNELAKPDRIKKETKFAEEHKEDSDEALMLVGKVLGNAVLKSAAKSVHAAADVELFGQQIIEQLRDF
ncbi:MAG: hypothetical protein IIY02_02325, partial [Firmicutes bacterium]|nr:hypothetical protein [Bacillota bacterium]